MLCIWRNNMSLGKIAFGFHSWQQRKNSWEMTFELAKGNCLPQPPLIPSVPRIGHYT